MIYPRSFNLEENIIGKLEVIAGVCSGVVVADVKILTLEGPTRRRKIEVYRNI